VIKVNSKRKALLFLLLSALIPVVLAYIVLKDVGKKIRSLIKIKN